MLGSCFCRFSTQLKYFRNYSSQKKSIRLENQTNKISIFSSTTTSKKSTINADNSDENQSKYNNFWNFFLNIADELHKITSGEDQVFQLLANEIIKVHSRLHFEIDKDPTLLFCESSITITANGDVNIFPIVLGLTQNCPTKKLTDKRWKVIAFKQRNITSPSHSLEMGSLVLKYSDVEFVAYQPNEESDEKKIKLIIRVQKGLISVSSHVEDMLTLMMVAVMGEYDFCTYLGHIQYVNEFEECDKKSIYDLSRLVEVVDSYVDSLNNE
jgi:hypothetical protein